MEFLSSHKVIYLSILYTLWTVENYEATQYENFLFFPLKSIIDDHKQPINTKRESLFTCEQIFLCVQFIFIPLQVS
jgi:hypothetical protein